MPAALVPKEVVVDRLLATFRASGYDGASLADLATATGLGKSSLYHYFPGGKREMAEVVLQRTEAILTDTFFAAIDGGGAPKRRLDAALRVLDDFYDGGRRACLLERLCASVDRDAFRPRLAADFAALVAGFARLAQSAGVAPKVAKARAEDAVVRVEGALVMAAGTGDVAVFARALARIRGELLVQPRA